VNCDAQVPVRVWINNLVKLGRRLRNCSFQFTSSVLILHFQHIILPYLSLNQDFVEFSILIDIRLLLVSVGPGEAAAAAPSGALEGMLSRKHEWESTTKKSNAR